jgi:adenosine deaminase
MDNKKLGKTAGYILDNEIPLEICITSNLHTGMYESAEKHPINNLIKLGFQVSLNTDNRLMSNTSIKKELEVARISGVTDPEALLLKSASYSFLS